MTEKKNFYNLFIFNGIKLDLIKKKKIKMLRNETLKKSLSASEHESEKQNVPNLPLHVITIYINISIYCMFISLLFQL